MFLRFIAAAGLICSMAAVAFAHPQTESAPQTRVVLDSDIRIFTIAAALSVANSSDTGKFGTDLDPDLVQRLQRYYAVHKGNRSDESQFAQYLGLAVSLTNPPELKPKVREERLPDETRAMLSFLDLLREFYLKAHISQRWIELRPQYDSELDRLQLKVSTVLLQTDAYLRTTLVGSGPRLLHINAELMAPPNSASLRVYENDYYLVLGPAATPNMDDVRHVYLHFHLDDVVNRSINRVVNNDKILALLSGEQGVNTTYTRDFRLMAVESLIRAMELRMDRSTAVHARDVVASSYRSGLLLTPYFYEVLLPFQSATASFRDVFPRIADGISYEAERDRFQLNFHAIPIPQRASAEVQETDSDPTPADALHELIVEAQTAYNSKDNDGARALFEKVLRDYDPNNGSALYGLGLLASRAADVQQSTLYFERTVKSNSADPGMKVWSYIYLGHIADLQCQRERATAYYQQAVQVGDNTLEAQASANSGLGKAFGDQCR